MAGVTCQVLAEGEIEPEECVIKIASLLRYVSIPVCTVVCNKAFAYIQKSELMFNLNTAHNIPVNFPVVCGYRCSVCATL